MGLYRLQRQFLHAVRGRGLPPHHVLPDRPDVMTRYRVTLRADNASRSPCCSPTAIWSKQSDLEDGRHAAIWDDPYRQAELPVCAGRRPLRRARSRRWRRSSGRDALLQVWVEPGNIDKTGARDGEPAAGDRLGREPLRPRARPRPLHDRRVQRLQRRGDGKQGAQHLQRQVRAGEPGDRDRYRLRPHRVDRRARVLPQLDRQPRDLPRLVPALVEGRAHGLPRPAVHGRHARGPKRHARQAHRRRAHAAGDSVSGGCRADGASGAPRGLPGDQQLLHRDRLRKGGGGGAHAAYAGRSRGFSPRDGAVLPPPRRRGGDL